MKRIVVTAGDARVGKSTISRLLLDLYLSEAMNVHVTYSGYRNKLDAYTKQIKIHKFSLQRGDYDEFIAYLQLIDDIDVVLMDMPGQILPEFINFERATYLLEGLHSIGYRVTFLHPISFRKDCIDYLHELTTHFKEKADYVVVKNGYFGDKFFYYDGKPIEEAIHRLGGATMHLPALSNFVYSKLEETNCTYADAAAKIPAAEVGKKIGVIERSYIFTWLNKFRLAIYSDLQLLRYLGLTV